MHTDRAAAALDSARADLTAAGLDADRLIARLTVADDDRYGTRADAALGRIARDLHRTADRLTGTRVRDHGRRGHSISVPVVRPATAATGDALYRVGTALDLIRCGA